VYYSEVNPSAYVLYSFALCATEIDWWLLGEAVHPLAQSIDASCPQLCHSDYCHVGDDPCGFWVLVHVGHHGGKRTMGIAHFKVLIGALFAPSNVLGICVQDQPSIAVADR
jgi:hypothetical protein